MAFELIEDALGDVRNGRTLALASDLAYLPADKGLKEFRSKLGLEGQLISVDNTQAYVAGNGDHLVVAFRGTESPTTFEGLKDWLLTDAVNLLILPQGRLGTDFAAAGVGARFHQGFVDAIAEIWNPLLTAVEAEQKRAERPLWITGHSLGGALALLSGWLFQRRFISVHQIYTFGAPMVGNAEATKAFDRELPQKIYRFVNSADPVPKLPTVSLIANDYGHVQTEVLMGTGPEASSSLELFSNFVNRTIDGVLNATLIDDLWKQVIGLVDAHLMPQYHALIDQLKR